MRQISKLIRQSFGQKKPKSALKDGVYFNVKNEQGYYERILGYQGENLLDSLQRFNLCESGICGGDAIDPMTRREIPYWSSGPFCRGCMIEIENPWYEKIQKEQGEIHYKEIDQLEKNYKNVPYGQNKRFACCILVEPWMNDMVIRLVDFADDNEGEGPYERKVFNQGKDLLTLVSH